MMNRKSSGFALRKSVRPRESQAPSSAGVPSSARRGFANRTMLDATRNSIGSGRISLYGQVHQKDPRAFNDEFIQKTFARINEFLQLKRLSPNCPVPTTNKLTLRQFETMFLILFRFIEPAYNPPSGNQWLEQEVPILMEGLSYPQKVTKSMMQTVSSRPGPVVGILDCLLDVALAMDTDPDEAIRLLSKDELGLQVETEELARSSFNKGLATTSSQLKEQVLDLCTRHKGIMDETEIQAERERVQAAQQEAEATLQLLEEQLAERERVEEECRQLEEYLSQMRSRQTSKQQELERMLEERQALAEKAVEIERLIAQTKNVVESQPISMDEIRAMRKETSDLQATGATLAAKMRTDESQLQALLSSVRIVEAELEAIGGELAQHFVNATCDLLRGLSRDELIVAAKNAERVSHLLEGITVELDLLNKKITKCRIQEEEQMFELNQRKQQLQTMVDYAKQDKEALDEKLSYFSSRLAEKLDETLNRRRAITNHDNQIVFLEKEVEELRIELRRHQGELRSAQTKFQRTQQEIAAAQKALQILKERIQRTIDADLSRMQQVTGFYREAFSALSFDEAVDAIREKLNIPYLQSFIDRSLKGRLCDKDA